MDTRDEADDSVKYEDELDSSDEVMENLKISVNNSEPDPTIAILKLEKTAEPQAEELPDVEVKLRTSSLTSTSRVHGEVSFILD